MSDLILRQYLSRLNIYRLFLTKHLVSVGDILDSSKFFFRRDEHHFKAKEKNELPVEAKYL